jgi:hypothetical protein
MFSTKSLTTGKKIPGARKEIPGFNRFGADPNSFWGQLQRIPAKYYLEIRKGGQVDSVISFPYDPSTMNYARQNPHNVTYTLGGVIREANTIRSHEITFEGRSGIAQRISYTRDGGISNLVGLDAFKEFDEFLKRYTELSNLDYGIRNKLITSPDEYVKKVTQTGASSNSVQMVVRCIQEDLHLFVEPMRFQYSRNAAANKHDIAYQLVLKAYDYAYSSAYSNKILNALDTADAYINAAAGAIGTVSNVIDNVSNDYVSRVRKPLRSVSSAMNRIKDIPQTAGSLARNVAGVVSDFNKAVEDVTSLYPSSEEFNQYFDGLSEDVVSLSSTKHSLRQTAQSMLNTPALTGDDILDTRTSQFVASLSALQNDSQVLRGFVPREYFNERHTGSEYRLGEWLSNESNLSSINQNGNNGSGEIDTRFTIPYEISKYDDLIQIATKITGTAANARLLQDLNGWRDFRRNAQGDYPQPGDKILIPNSLLIENNPFLAEGDLIGFDIRMPYNDAVLNDRLQEIELISGIDNVKQAVKNALFTVAGELPGFETYGLRNLSRINDSSYLATLIRDLLISDPRISDANNIIIEIEQSTVNVSLDLKTINNETFPLRAPYPI